jgi:hypothetical protein
MSLIGEVSGVGLPELLQVSALAGGRSVLEIRSEGRAAWLSFEAGAIVRFARSDLELGNTEEKSPGVETADVDSGELWTPEAENALLDVFRWKEGTFVLHCGDELPAWPGPSGIQFRVPIRPESVALGAARRLDEERRPGGGSGAAAEESKAEGGRGEGRALPVVVVDPDLRLLAALKDGLSPHSARVHTFNRSADAWFRIQQYLVRGEIPALVMDSSVLDPVEPGARPGWRRFASRLHGIAPAARVVLLASAESPSSPALHSVLRRPADPAGPPEEMRELVGALRRALGLGEGLGA